MAPTLDLRLLLDLNSMTSANGRANAWDFIGNNPLYRGGPVLFPIAALWFSTGGVIRRGRMLIGLLSTCVAVLISVWLQHHLEVHARPFLDPALHLKNTPPLWGVGLRHLNSFPSDTATLFFSLCTVLFLERRLIGGIAFIWSLFTVGVARVGAGWHYPSDVVAAFILGPGCVFLLTRIRPLQIYLEGRLERWQPRLYLVHAALFLFLADAYVLFDGLQGFYSFFGKTAAYFFSRL